MTSMIIELAFSGILPYIAPLVFILSSFVVGEHLLVLMRNSFVISSTNGKSRRT